MALGCNHSGFAYEHGNGAVKKDKNKALEYYSKACDLKSPHGCENYARLKRQACRTGFSCPAGKANPATRETITPGG
jgi:TPR repeat protein